MTTTNPPPGEPMKMRRVWVLFKNGNVQQVTDNESLARSLQKGFVDPQEELDADYCDHFRLAELIERSESDRALAEKDAVIARLQAQVDAMRPFVQKMWESFAEGYEVAHSEIGEAFLESPLVNCREAQQGQTLYDIDGDEVDYILELNDLGRTALSQQPEGRGDE